MDLLATLHARELNIAGPRCVCPLGSIDTKMLPEDNVYKVNNDNYRLQQHMVPVLTFVTNAGEGGTFLAPGIYSWKLLPSIRNPCKASSTPG